MPVGDAVPGLDDRSDSAFVLRANRDYALGEEVRHHPCLVALKRGGGLARQVAGGSKAARAHGSNGTTGTAAGARAADHDTPMPSPPLPVQVLISYGPNSSTQLLCQYGFAPPPGANANEAAYLVPFGPEGSPYPTGRPSHKLPADAAHRVNGSLPLEWYALPALFVDLLVTHTDPRVLGLESPEAAEALMRMQSDPYANLFDLPSRGAVQRRQWNPTADFMALEALRRACLAQLAGAFRLAPWAPAGRAGGHAGGAA